MTPEEVEQRLELLQTPLPPERLRERCLTGSSPRRPARPRLALAIAASFLIIAFIFWLIATSRPVPAREQIATLIGRLGDPDPVERDRAAVRLIELGGTARPQIDQARNHRDTEIAFRAKQIWDNPERSLQLIQATDDPVLRVKLDRVLRVNPGMGVLVVRVRELRDGKFRPVTRGFRLKIFLEAADEDPDPLVHPEGPRADVDSDGFMLFVTAPGRYRSVGFWDDPDEALKKLSFAWEYRPLALEAGRVLLLSDAVFAPWMRWSAPDEKSEVSVKEDPKISWIPYPEVRRVKIDYDRKAIFLDGVVSLLRLGSILLDCPNDSALPLSDLRKAAVRPFGAGDTIVLTMTGYDSAGKILTRTKDELEFDLKK